MTDEADPLDEMERFSREWARKSRRLAYACNAVTGLAILVNLVVIFRGDARVWNYAAVAVLVAVVVANATAYYRFVRNRDETLLWVTRRRMGREDP